MDRPRNCKVWWATALRTRSRTVGALESCTLFTLISRYIVSREYADGPALSAVHASRSSFTPLCTKHEDTHTRPHCIRTVQIVQCSLYFGLAHECRFTILLSLFDRKLATPLGPNSRNMNEFAQINPTLNFSIGGARAQDTPLNSLNHSATQFSIKRDKATSLRGADLYSSSTRFSRIPSADAEIIFYTQLGHGLLPHCPHLTTHCDD